MESFAQSVSQAHDWIPNPERHENPKINSSADFTQVRIVDLYTLRPADQVAFQISASPVYLVQIAEDEQVTAWINTANGGLTASKDKLATINLQTKNQLEKIYLGALIANGFYRMRNRIAMPYFSFDRDQIQPPANVWVDAPIKIWIKKS